MHIEIVERRVRCPFCGESQTITLDLSAGGQAYIEDCQVCCQPMEIRFDVEDGGSANLEVGRAG